MSFMDAFKTRLLNLECHFTWALREEDFNLHDLVNRLHEQIKLESGKARVTRAYSSLAFISFLYGDLQAALTNLHKSEELAKECYGKASDTVLTVTYGDLAWLYYHMKQFPSAEDYLRLVHRINENFSGASSHVICSEVLREKGWAFLRFSRKYYNGARECFRQAVEIDPNDNDLNAGYAIALYRTTDPGSQDSLTIAQLRRAIGLNPKDAVLLVLLALRLIYPNNSPTSPKSETHGPFRLKQQFSEPVGLVVKALEMSPENPHVMRYVAQFSRKLGSVDFAICQLEKTLVHTPDSAFIHHQLALCYKSQKKILEKKYGPCYKVDHCDMQNCLRKCIYHLERAVSLKPSFVVALAELAVHHGQMKNIPKAEMLFQQAFKLAKEQKEHLEAVHALYGKFQYYSKGSEQLAVYHYMEGLRLQVDTSEGKHCEDKLKQIARFRSTKTENDSKAFAIYGFIHELKGETSKALACYERASIEGLGIGESPLLTELRVWILGFTGAEKSARNVMLGSSVHDEGPQDSGRPAVLKGKIAKKTVCVVETDLCNGIKVLTREKSLLAPGPHAIVLAFLHDGEFTKDTKKILEDLEIFGESFWKHVIVLFTNEDTCIRGQEGALQWLLEKCGHRYYIAGTGTEITQTMELSDRILTMISRNNNMHLVIPVVSSNQPSLKMVQESESSLPQFTPDIATESGQTMYRFLCIDAGWFHCSITHLRFRMNGEGEVLYSTVVEDSSCPVSTNHYAAGPLYDIRCVQGELSQLQLPHCEVSPDDCNFMTVAHYTDRGVEALKPEYITHTHVTVSIPGTSKFRLQDILNFFKRKIRGQIILMYHPPPKNWLHVFLRPWNVDPKLLCEQECKHIPGAFEIDLKHSRRYIISCEDAEEPRRRQKIQASDGLFLRDKYTDNPTFAIYLDKNTVNVKMQLREDRSDGKPWEFDLPPLTVFQETSMSVNERTTQTALVQHPARPPPAGCSVVVKAEQGSTATSPTLCGNTFYGPIYMNPNAAGNEH